MWSAYSSSPLNIAGLHLREGDRRWLKRLRNVCILNTAKLPAVAIMHACPFTCLAYRKPACSCSAGCCVRRIHFHVEGKSTCSGHGRGYSVHYLKVWHELWPPHCGANPFLKLLTFCVSTSYWKKFICGSLTACLGIGVPALVPDTQLFYAYCVYCGESINPKQLSSTRGTV